MSLTGRDDSDQREKGGARDEDAEPHGAVVGRRGNFDGDDRGQGGPEGVGEFAAEAETAGSQLSFDRNIIRFRYPALWCRTASHVCTARPKPAEVKWLTEEQEWTDAEELGRLGPVLNQDANNIPEVQRGMSPCATTGGV